MKKATKNASQRLPHPRIKRSAGNVFADLGLRDSQDRLARAALTHAISKLIDDSGLTRSQAANRLGIDQPKVSMLMRGRLKDFSTERLMRFVVLMGRDIVIGIESPADVRRPGMRVLVGA
jgi:predicted XRE-type DNA-binding protein